MVQQDYIHKVPIITLCSSNLIYMIAAATQADESSTAQTAEKC